MRASIRMSSLTASDDTMFRCIFVLAWVFIIGVGPWLVWQSTDVGRWAIGLRVAASILSTPIAYLFGWRWGFWPMGVIIRDKETPKAEPLIE